MIVSCSSPHMTGVVIEVSEEKLYVAEQMTKAEYEEIKGKTVNELVSSGIGIRLIALTYEDTDEFVAGDVVHIWLDGDIMEFYPAEAKAKKIALQ